MDDPDAPVGTWDHWVAYDIEPLSEIPEAVEALGTTGTNSWGNTGYGGPCPPSGTHRYFFQALALDARLGWEEGADKTSVLEAIHDHVLAEATLLGFYGRNVTDEKYDNARLLPTDYVLVILNNDRSEFGLRYLYRFGL